MSSKALIAGVGMVKFAKPSASEALSSMIRTAGLLMGYSFSANSACAPSFLA